MESNFYIKKQAFWGNSQWFVRRFMVVCGTELFISIIVDIFNIIAKGTSDVSMAIFGQSTALIHGFCLVFIYSKMPRLAVSSAHILYTVNL